jgi:hypothetical protein
MSNETNDERPVHWSALTGARDIGGKTKTYVQEEGPLSKKLSKTNDLTWKCGPVAPDKRGEERLAVSLVDSRSGQNRLKKRNYTEEQVGRGKHVLK